MQQQIDTLIQAEWIIPVIPEGEVLENHALAIDGGRIIGLLPADQAASRYQAENRLELPGQALIPGLVNAHTHLAMSLLRGLADDLPLMSWLNQHIWPAEQRWVSEEFVHDGSQLAMAEMLCGGTTCFNDMYFFPDVTARAAHAAGMRAMVGLITIDFPSVWAADWEEYLHKGLEVHDQFRSNGLIKTAFAPHAPYSVSDAPLERIQVLSDELEIPVHIHLHETNDEIVQGLQQHNDRPMARLQRLGLLSPTLQAVHMIHLEEGEISRFAESGGHVIHCPESNLKLASGFCPVAKLLEAGVNLALGTDGAASNNDLDMFSEMRSAALLAKGVAGDAATLPAAQALSMATINGARALGLEQEIGSLEVGKSADLAAVDLNRLNTQPVYHPISQIVYAAGREQVSQVWVAGRQLVHNGCLTTLDSGELISRAASWRERIAEG
ncbi:TRZ/ATZ family hydrolase [endosymbiont of Ridgeia piscesae]|jgi:5-methylthioadenosine/S-adenosylhomocysteine deaminase|uniref:5-methylthioadenosine/S-adenosylhomocysteine deaminase n=1 Tax=endosymbiont of Ridgeia piscesae TaxID=54398 RepID=A0A0T5ZAR8_9GAMM|nr:TRZ/ATZ family hydrolase [endosymbiont of Ridgeia piscesae]KRT55957.1 Cytosine/adenosine deaminase or related metal-dependent hydrolase [endosymbiont of Ridgeia piscesae]KRT59961.1 Cytosine/adenosine deaminase [endosymbiont of Ridgeia piscesae]